jgi:hypothetical protein
VTRPSATGAGAGAHPRHYSRGRGETGHSARAIHASRSAVAAGFGRRVVGVAQVLADCCGCVGRLCLPGLLEVVLVETKDAFSQVHQWVWAQEDG